MERDGAVHGYSLSERIAERTGGVWRPGPGAIYPALQRLTDRGLARARLVGRRRVYTITPKGREALARLRAQTSGWTSRAPDLSALWADVAGVDDVATFLLLRLRRALDAIDATLATPPPAGNGNASLTSLRADVLAELSARVTALGRRGGHAIAAPPRRRTRRGP